MTTNKLPRSVRLTQAHRKDMLDAVMAEWQKQNPAPENSDPWEIHRLVARHFVKTQSGKRTKAYQPLFKNAVKVRSAINVQIMRDNEVMDTRQYRIPLSIANSVGMPLLDELDVSYRDCTKEMAKLLPESDIYNVDDDGDYHIKYAPYWGTGNNETIVMEYDSEALSKLREATKARQTWQKEYDKLRGETSDLLSQFNTTNQIRESWPEMVDYLPPHIADPDRAVKLPVLATSRLNERLGLVK